MTDIIVLDFETFYSPEYTLRKLTMEEYIRSPLFEPLVMSIGRYEPGKNRMISSARGAEEIGKWIKAIDWGNVAVIAQNAAFDVGILSLVYGVTPKLVMCTMSMERAIAGPGKSASLAAMCERYGLSQKTVPYNQFIGKRWAEMDEALQQQLVSGCEHDVWLTREIARKQLAMFPKQELPVVDMTIRMFTEPQFAGDAPKLRAIALEEFERKGDAMAELGVMAAELQSADKFVALIEDCGEEVPLKQGKLKEIACVAKTDPYMQELAGRSDRAGLLAQARLDVRSTLDEARASRLAGSAERGLMPVALNYCGAATTRWSGADRVNWQNLPGGRQDPEMRLRKSILAPPGKKLVVADFAQIEYRVCCMLAGQIDKLDALRSGRDIYKEFASVRLFLKPIVEITKLERNFSKKPVLGGIFGIGVDKFLRTCDAEGISDIPYNIKSAAIPAFRADHPYVCQLWRINDEALNALSDTDFVGRPDGYEDFPVWFDKGSVALPNGVRCPFSLEWDQRRNTWVRKTRHGFTKYWGGGLTEFLCQSIARVILSGVMLRVRKELGLRPALLVHDELVYVVDEEVAEGTLLWLLKWMGESPAWWPEVPLGAEGWVSDRYGK